MVSGETLARVDWAVCNRAQDEPRSALDRGRARGPATVARVGVHARPPTTLGAAKALALAPEWVRSVALTYPDIH